MGMTFTTLNLYGADRSTILPMLLPSDQLREQNSPWLTVVPSHDTEDGNPERLTKTAKKLTKGNDAAALLFYYFDDDMFCCTLYQKQSNQAWDDAARAGRSRFSEPVLIAKSDRNDLRQVIRTMRQGLPFFYLPDMDHGARNSVFVPFFGVQAATLPMVSRLARLTKSKVVFMVSEMTDDGYVVHVSDFWKDFPTDDYVADTRRVTAELEKWILRLPDQYMWLHRRFKTRPEGEPSVYD